MSRLYTQFIVFAAFGIAFCQGSTEIAPVEIKETAIVNEVKVGDSTKNDTDLKAAIGAKPDSVLSAFPDDPSELITEPAPVQDSSDISGESGSAVVIEDSVRVVDKSDKLSMSERNGTGGRNGIGVNLTVKLIVAKTINDYLDDLYEKMKDDANGTITDEVGFSAMPVLFGLKLKGIVNIGPVISLEPFGTINYGIKLMRIRNLDKDVTANLIEYGGGLNMWARVSPGRMVSFKTGLGGYITYTYLNVVSYDGTVNHSGIGGGLNLLAGIDIMLKKITVNVDFSIPIGSSELTQDGDFTNKGNNQIRYPGRYRHTGIEFRPGVTFHF